LRLEIRWQSAAERDLSRLDRSTKERVIAAVERFAATGEGDVVRLRDVNPAEWRLRVGKWRIRFRHDHTAGMIQVLRVQRRDQAY
jgi:mRNA-degrading endonuclease RelE of RelBE toxin-antitoxin system